MDQSAISTIADGAEPDAGSRSGSSRTRRCVSRARPAHPHAAVAALTPPGMAVPSRLSILTSHLPPPRGVTAPEDKTVIPGDAR